MENNPQKIILHETDTEVLEQSGLAAQLAAMAEAALEKQTRPISSQIAASIAESSKEFEPLDPATIERYQTFTVAKICSIPTSGVSTLILRKDDVFEVLDITNQAIMIEFRNGAQTFIPLECAKAVMVERNNL